MSPIHRIGFVGVGRMGAPMAGHLQRAGFAVRVWDEAPAARAAAGAAGLSVAGSRAELCDTDLLLLMLPSDDAVRSVVESPAFLDSLRTGQIVVDMGTSKIATSQRAAAALAAREVGFLDAPVSGGESGAHAATLSVMVGGDPGTFERCRPVFAALGTSVTYIGGSGMGLIAKYVNQLLVEVTATAVAEGFALAAQAGADLDAVFQAVRGGLGGSRMLELVAPQILSGNLGEGRELTLVQKDSAYLRETAAQLGAWTPLTEVSHELFTRALALGFGVHSTAGVARVYEAQTGVRLVTEPAPPDPSE